MLLSGLPKIQIFYNLRRSPEAAGIVFRHFGAQLRKANTPLRSGPAGRVGPSLRALLLLAARKSQAILHVLIGFISQHFRGAAVQRKLELRRSAFCARLLRRH